MARHRAFEASPVVAEILRARQPATGRSRPSERPVALALTAAGEQARQGRLAAVPSPPLPRLAMPRWRALLDRLVRQAAPTRVGQ